MTFRIGIDIGGTFTDFALFNATAHTLAIHKQLTTPKDPSRAVIEGVRELLTGAQIRIEEVLDIVHGTTLVTNAVIEGRGARTGMLTTSGFRDILDMREEKRYDIFDLRITFPQPVVPRALRAEVDERCRFDGTVERVVDLDMAESATARLINEHGIEALAICFLHAYANPEHELAVAERLRDRFPDLYLCTSGEVFPGRREYDRFTTTCINAYTQPLFDRYLGRIESSLSTLGFKGRFYVMSSSGGTLDPAIARQFPVRVIESGPAAGVQMSMFHGRSLAVSDLLSFDMGGTTAKGALVRDGQAIRVYSHEVARQHEFMAGSGLPVRAPVIDLIEIGAGGGSIAHIDARGTIRVGPRSASADPGPVCYGRGGTEPTLTDANLLLGYLDPEFFLGGAMRLDLDAARTAVRDRIADPLSLGIERAAFGIHDIINEDVARTFRIHASERGFDYRNSTMVGFGGSGPLHALAVARKLRIPRVVFPVAAGVMSALGLLASPLAFEVTRTHERFLENIPEAEFQTLFGELELQAQAPLVKAGLGSDAIRVVRRADMRYHGQGHEIEVSIPGTATLSDMATLFTSQYERLYGATFLDAPVVITAWKVQAEGPAAELTSGYRLGLMDTGSDDAQPGGTARAVSRAQDAIKSERDAYFGSLSHTIATPVYDRYRLLPGWRIDGPALIEERESTVVIGPGDTVEVDPHYNLVASLSAGPSDARYKSTSTASRGQTS